MGDAVGVGGGAEGGVEDAVELGGGEEGEEVREG